jgi:hypothetical protein
MSWSEAFNSSQLPSYEDIRQYLGNEVSLWDELLAYLERAYQVQPKMAYSKCAAQPGWNVKYQKSGKSLCTLYPMDGFFIALVVVGAKEEPQAEIALESFTPYVKNTYLRTSFSCGGRWLMLEVKDKNVLEDIKTLIAIRVKPKAA